MKNKKRFKELDIKVFIIPFIITTLVFFVIGYITVKSIESHYYDLKKEEALKLARGYSRTVTKSSEAYTIVDQLLEQKLSVASKIIALYGNSYSNELFAEIAHTLEVDEIDYYNPQGEIIYTNMNELIGWKTYKGHPIYDFMISDRIRLFEEIRQDVLTGIYYKYGYIKFPDGSFLQIGIRADKIKKFFGSFEMQQLLEHMKEDAAVDHICFIGNDLYITASTEYELIGKEMSNSRVKTEIFADREYGYIKNVDGEKFYEVFVPVKSKGSRIGTFAIRYSLKDTQGIASHATIIGLLLLTIIYASLLYTMMSEYKKDKRLVQLAYYDQLTGLPNKEYLKKLLTKELNENEVKEKAVLLINCNNFRIVNITFGYEYGDEILKKLSKKVQDIIDDDKMLFRFTADRFVLYVRNYHENADLITLAKRISEVFYQPFHVKDAKHYLTAQIGIVKINNKYDNVDKLLKDASIAINNIKMNDVCNYAFFNVEMETKLLRAEMIERELRTAIDEQDDTKLYLEYQPQVDLRTNQIIGFEALARMKSDHFGVISPLEFIDIAERKQLIVSLGNIILNKACKFSARLNTMGHKNIKMAVNISGVQLMREEFIDTVMDIIKETKMNKSTLELEITESFLIDNYFGIINDKFKELQNHKIEISLDDFGTGYSSFFRLRELNVDTLKIDRYFISKITMREDNELLTGDIISMAHKLGLRVVAEGVELQVQKDYLIENHCDIMQGYLFSKPLPEKDAIVLLKENNIKGSMLDSTI